MAEIGNSTLLDQGTGIPGPGDALVVIVRTEWNAGIVDELERGCILALQAGSVKEIQVVKVPGAIEIPFMIARYWDAKKDTPRAPLAFIALASVIRGDTPHFDYVCQAVTEGVGRLNLSLPVPVIFGVLTVDNEQQARERIGGKHGHKGEEAAITAMKMIRLMQSLKNAAPAGGS
jgi:6,7-dimethyl-8-ribityllumazine synthase